ncbi:MAG: low molecular weight protein arginine phosphatase [Christensenellales bacterium]
MNILFVCTGNTCRSPMAERLMKKLAQELNRNDISVRSAGLSAFDGAAASEGAKKAMEHMELSLEGFSSSMLSLNDVEWADIILTMEGRHAIYIASRYQGAAKNLHTLKGYAKGKQGEDGYHLNVEDPYGGSLSQYLECADEIQSALKSIFDNGSDI